MSEKTLNHLRKQLGLYEREEFTCDCQLVNRWSKWSYYPDEYYRGRTCLNCGEYDVDPITEEEIYTTYRDDCKPALPDSEE